jgi:carboxymethylenebutenolidase
VRAAASFYGVELVTDRPDSPHLAPQKTDARLYFGCAELDKLIPREMVEQLQAHVARGGNAEVEIYAGVDHGFAFPLRPVYNKAAADRHWERIFELFAPLHSGT